MKPTVFAAPLVFLISLSVFAQDPKPEEKKDQPQNNPAPKEDLKFDPMDPNLTSFSTDSLTGRKTYKYVDGRVVVVDKDGAVVSVALNAPVVESDDADSAIRPVMGPQANSPKSPDKPSESGAPASLHGHVAAKGGMTEIGGVGGVTATIAGKVGKATEASSGSIEIVMGKPFLRIKGSAELFPIQMMDPKPLDLGIYGGATIFKLPFRALNVDGRITLDGPDAAKGKKVSLANSSIVVTPDVAAQLIHLNGSVAYGLKATAMVTGGLAGGYAKDGDGHSPIAGLSFGGGGEVTIMVYPRHMVSAGASAKIIPNLFPLAQGRPLSWDFLVKAGAEYRYHAGEGLQFFVGPQFETDRFDVKPVFGAKNTSSGATTILGGQFGIAFQ